MARDSDGNVIKVGQGIGFKSDIEQWGKVTKIDGRSITIESQSESGFSGEYIGGQTIIVEDADRCWSE